MSILKNVAAAALVSVTLTGCATMFADDPQQIEVRTVDNGSADCKLRNEKGAYAVTAPGTVTVPRDTSRLYIECSRGGKKGRTSNRAGPNPVTFVNLLSPFGLGFLVDYSNGSMGEYDELVYVPMD